MYFLIALPPLLIILAVIVGILVSAPGYKGPKSDHFTGKKFINYDNTEAKGLLNVFKWMFSREQGEWKEITDRPTTTPNNSEDFLTVYFLNHATFLIQWKGINILTDPVLSERVSPFSFAGPKRMRPPGIAFEKIPKIDFILLSHNHYDHLDLPTLKKLRKRDNPELIVPLGVDLYLKKEGFDKVTALDWWEGMNYSNLNIDMVPAQHFSSRGMLDRDKTLWGGYMINDEKDKLYFVGDTGYNKRMFDDIAEKHPDIDITLIPIGAYQPKWFMSPIHISPEEAVIVHKQIRSNKSVAMHYGTFPLADDGQTDPQNDLADALQKYNVHEKDFIILNEGDKLIVNSSENQL